MAIAMASFVSSDPDFLQDVCVANLESGNPNPFGKLISNIMYLFFVRFNEKKL